MSRVARGNKIAQSKTSISNVEAPIQKPQKCKYSAWMVTVNTNIPWPNPTDPRMRPFCEALGQTIDSILDDDDELKGVLNINTRVKNRNLDSSLSEFVVERGPIKKTVHAHGVIQIKHQSNIQLSYPKFKAAVFKDLKRLCRQKNLPIPNGLYVHYDFLAKLCSQLKDKQAILDYIKKNMKEIDASTEGVYTVGDVGKKEHEYEPYIKQEQPDEEIPDSEAAPDEETDYGEQILTQTSGYSENNAKDYILSDLETNQVSSDENVEIPEAREFLKRKTPGMLANVDKREQNDVGYNEQSGYREEGEKREKKKVKYTPLQLPDLVDARE